VVEELGEPLRGLLFGWVGAHADEIVRDRG
jgi:hypothetical protein